MKIAKTFFSKSSKKILVRDIKEIFLPKLPRCLKCFRNKISAHVDHWIALYKSFGEKKNICGQGPDDVRKAVVTRNSEKIYCIRRMLTLSENIF